MTELKKVNLYKIKVGRDFGAFLKGDLSNYDHINNEAAGYEAYIKYAVGGGAEKTESQVPWIAFLNSAFSETKYRYSAFNKFPRAILAIKIKVENTYICYVATFGQHGDSYLDKNHITRDFGIKVGMNICDIDDLRKIQTTVHESISQQTERQASTGANLKVFGINNESELLRTISGCVHKDYKNIIDSFKGKDSISLKFAENAPLDWAKLVELCKKMEERYHSEDYKQTDFKVYDILRHETDPEITDQLDTILCKTISNKNFSKIHLAPPEFVEFSDISYCYKKKEGQVTPPLFEDLNIHDLIAAPRRRIANLKISTIKSWPIYTYDHEQEKTYEKWDAYQCVVAEVTLNEKIYILSNGQWREVSNDLQEKVKRYFQSNNLNMSVDYLPSNIRIFDSERNQNREEIYNAAACQSSGSLFLFDQAKITIASEKKYEVCDLLSADKHLIHVKKYSSGASSISHLFTQGRFYSRAFSTDAVCRKEMTDWIETNTDEVNAGKNKAIFKSIIPEKSIDVLEGDYKIIFCVLHEAENFGIKDLPFMSQYELMNSHKYLTEDRKFKCGIAFKKVLLGAES